jgi:hypothetical protein
MQRQVVFERYQIYHLGRGFVVIVSCEIEGGVLQRYPVQCVHTIHKHTHASGKNKKLPEPEEYIVQRKRLCEKSK